MEFFKHTHYRDLLKASVEAKKAIDTAFTYQSLAEEMRIQKSYLSKVIAGGAELSADQMYLAGEALGWSIEQKKFAEVLLEWSRAGVQSRKAELEKELRALRAEKLETKAHLKSKVVEQGTQEFTEYYLDPIHQLVHIALTIEKYQKDTKSLAHDLDFAEARVIEAIETLIRIGVVARVGKTIQPQEMSLHLPRESPLYRSWRAQLRNLSLMRLQTQKDPNSYSYSVVISATPEIRDQIREKFLAFLKETQELVADAKPEEVYQLNFDLLGWT